MRVALFHNRYRQRGGEDAAVDFQLELLRKAGHEAELFALDNRDALASPLRVLGAALQVRWNRGIEARVARFLDAHPADVAHVHNFFPLLTPALHHALQARGVPVVQTLHNYRLLCANGLFLRRGRACEECVARGPWNALRYGCYRGSRLQTAVWAEATAYHRRRRTWLEQVDLFTTPSAFARRKLVAGGLPPERVRVEPNPVADPGAPAPPGRGAVYVGRLSAEKGVGLLLEAWRELGGYPLAILGTGPQEAALRRAGAGIDGVRFLGHVGPGRVAEELRRAAFLVAPSLCYELFPVAVAEAMAAGRAAVAGTPSSVSELVEAGLTGLHFAIGDARDLARACRELAADPERAAEMGRQARRHYEETLAPARAVERLEALYARVLETA